MCRAIVVTDSSINPSDLTIMLKEYFEERGLDPGKVEQISYRAFDGEVASADIVLLDIAEHSVKPIFNAMNEIDESRRPLFLCAYRLLGRSVQEAAIRNGAKDCLLLHYSEADPKMKIRSFFRKNIPRELTQPALV